MEGRSETKLGIQEHIPALALRNMEGRSETKLRTNIEDLPLPNILNYYTYNVDTLWTMVMVVILMIVSTLFLKLVEWNTIFRHFGKCYPMGNMLGHGATRCASLPIPQHFDETFVVGPGVESTVDKYPSLYQLSVSPIQHILQWMWYQLQACTRAVVFYGKQADRMILDMHDTVQNTRTMIYNEYIRSYVPIL